MADMPDFNAKLWSQNLSAVLDRNRDMAACRKLKQDIEQTLKKVADGILLFNEFNKKMEESQNVKDRDKAMMEMKRELKKLQRIREQIRTWANDATIRDTSLLIEARRAIEHQMEHFKECEKEAKLKPFAKAALAAKNERIDPVVQAKEEAQRWLRDSVMRLAEQVEGFEADVEICPEKDKDLEPLIENHKMHITRLEQVMRLLENDQVEPNDLGNLKDSMEHYLQDAAEPDFVEDTLMYESLPLGEVDSRVGHIARHEKDKGKNEANTEQEDSEDEEPPSPDGAKGSARQACAGDTRAGKRKKEGSATPAKKRPPKMKAVPFAQGIVITGNTARQAVTAAAQQTQERPARAAPEPAKDAPAQRRAVALPKPLASDHLRSGKTSPDTGGEETPLEDGSPPSVHLPNQARHDFEASVTEQLQGYDSFSLPPGLYVSEASILLGTQMPNQAQHGSPAQLQTQGCHITADDGSALRGMANHLETFDNKQFMGADTQYFQTAQMKLHAREERLQDEVVGMQLERAQQMALAQQQQQQILQLQMQMQLQQQQQQQQQQQPPAPPPRAPPPEYQAVNTSFASPVAQRQASREVFGLGSDGEDTTFGMPYSPGTLPTVEEEGSQELTSESFEDHKKPGGQGREPREARRRRGGRGKRSHDDSTSPSLDHRKPPSPKLFDMIMPALAKAKAQSEALEKQMCGSGAQEGKTAPVPGADADSNVTASSEELAADLRSFADVVKPAQLLQPWAQIAQGSPVRGQGQGSQPVTPVSLAGQQKEAQATPVSQGQQSLFAQQPSSSSTGTYHDDSHFPPLMPSFSPWLRQVTTHQPSPSGEKPGLAANSNSPQTEPANNILTPEQYQQLLHLQQAQQQQQLQQQIHAQLQMQQAAQAAAAQQKMSPSKDFQTYSPDKDAPQARQPPEVAAAAGPWSIKADWQPFSHKWQSELRATLPPLDKGPVNPERAGERIRPPALNIWGEREGYKPSSPAGQRPPSPSHIAAVDSSLNHRPDDADQAYSTVHLYRSQGRACSLRDLPEPLHADTSGRAAAEQFPVKAGLIPQLFEKQEFFDKIAERSQLTGQSPDLLFFAFYHQQGTTQQYCAAAALQKLSWVFNPQTKRWYKAASPTADSFRRAAGSMDQGACMYFDNGFKQKGINTWEGWSIKHSTNSFGPGRVHHPSYP